MVINRYIIILIIAIFFDALPQVNISLSDLNNKGNEILAKVGSREITVKEFLSGYEYGPAYPKREKNSKEIYLDYLINEKLIANEGYLKELDTSSVILNNLAAIKADLASEELFKDKILSQVKITPDEVNFGIENRLTMIEVKWLYAPALDSLTKLRELLKNGVPFDTIFYIQLSDEILSDERSMVVDLFKLRNRNPAFAGSIEKLNPGDISSVIQGEDGYYIIYLIKKWKEIKIGETAEQDIYLEVGNYLKQKKADSLSAIFVDSIITSYKPIINGHAFNILRSYFGKYELDSSKIINWKLKERADSSIKELKISEDKIGDAVLVTQLNDKLKLKDFISWFQIRNQYLRFDNNSFNLFSSSLEKMIWQMVRDNLLTKISFGFGYDKKSNVKEQLEWWRDKIVYAVERDNFLNSVSLVNEQPDRNQLKSERNKKLFQKLKELREKYPVIINNQLLSSISVGEEDNPKAVDFYIVKKGGIFPRPAFPSIDYLWQELQ